MPASTQRAKEPRDEHAAVSFYEPAELLGEGALDLQDLARHCQRNTAWVVERVQTGVLYCENEPAGDAADAQAQWRFSSHMLVRARRIAHLEHS